MGAEAFDVEYDIGRALDLAQVLGGTDQEAGQARAAHQAWPGVQAGPAGAPASEPDAAASGKAAPALTPRELEVLSLVAQGLSNPDIAQRLALSEHTVHRHLANILRKLGLPSRVAAAAWGARNGLI
jgi:DNA-binding NarL/FixJ family response regulator